MRITGIILLVVTLAASAQLRTAGRMAILRPKASAGAAPDAPAQPTWGEWFSFCPQIRAQWSAVSGATGYRLDVATASDFSSMLIDNLDVGNVLNYSLSPNVTVNHYCRVRAYNGNGTSASSVSSTAINDTQGCP